jgi:hypothetical protein
MMLAVRALIFIIFLAISCLIAEAVFVLAMGRAGHHVHFSSIFALGLFAVFVAGVATYPSPSRISTLPIGMQGRLLLIAESSASVGLAIFTSSRFTAYRHLTIPIDLWFAVSWYVLVLVVTGLANLKRLKHEIRMSRSQTTQGDISQ